MNSRTRKEEAPDDHVTPMMAQYLAVKKEHPDALLFYRMGDFFELFFDDAVVAAQALDIALTTRGRHLGRDIPMCGVPTKAHEAYLERLICKGFRVAICEQAEDPAEARKRGPKAVVRREVQRVVTRGTLTEDTLLDARRHNYLAALVEVRGEIALAWADVSTGDFQVQLLQAKDLAAALSRLDAGELLVPEDLLHKQEISSLLADWRDRVAPLPGSRFDSQNGRQRLEALFKVRTLDAYGGFTRAELAAAGALIDYVELTQKGRLPRISPPKRLAQGAVMEIDAATRRNLELAVTLSGEHKGCLLSVIDKTLTGGGARLLAERLGAPLTDPTDINCRLDAIQFFVDFEQIRNEIRDLLRRCPDMERGLSRLTLGRGGPRDLAAMRDGLERVAELRLALTQKGLADLPSGIKTSIESLGRHEEIVNRLTRALGVNLPIHARDGGFIAAEYSHRLDELRALRDESHRLVANLQARYISDTGVSTLKIRYNKVLGFFIEVPAKQSGKIPSGAEAPFIHRQTMSNAVRYATVELGGLESQISRAADQALALELELFDGLVEKVSERADPIAQAAQAVADIDVASALAELALDRRYVRPVVDQSNKFEVSGGRHPVVEVALESVGERAFVANGCSLSDSSQLWLLTGPNMAGKSTFLRQNALIAILAQMGSYVPAESACIGVVDRLFSRVGAADDLARGRSTFMVEMVETAAILNQAGPRALVILDEIGRGTATFDGLSIAWAVVEHLAEVNRCRALFATHYHELTHLSAKLDGMACHTMRVKEWQGGVIFLHEVAPGAADRSYGIHVGQLAGLPAAVIARSEQVLQTLEKGEQSSAITRLADDLPLFSAMAGRAPRLPAEAVPSPAIKALDAVNPDELTPRGALDFVYKLKALQTK